MTTEKVRIMTQALSTRTISCISNMDRECKTTTLDELHQMYRGTFDWQAPRGQAVRAWLKTFTIRDLLKVKNLGKRTAAEILAFAGGGSSFDLHHCPSCTCKAEFVRSKSEGLRVHFVKEDGARTRCGFSTNPVMVAAVSTASSKLEDVTCKVCLALASKDAAKKVGKT